ncbi:MAG: DUF4296 domain-containing protein [Chlorobiaceae bacterium]|nr:DUF4296 domain-containing protein [Chlorobiaceae bacterium]
MSNKVLSGLVGQSRRLPVLAFFALLLAGCGMQSGPKLDATDMKFAAFYGDYLVRSGTTLPDSGADSPSMTAGELDSLFARNGIDQKAFDTKLRSYSKDPALWREVLLQVRKNLRRQQ